MLDNFGGNFGRLWRETAERNAKPEMLIRDLMDGQYSRPARIIAFNTTEGWSRDMTVDIADELRRRFAEYDDVPDFCGAATRDGKALKSGQELSARAAALSK